MNTPAQILKTVFGYDHFRDQQETIINHVVSGGSCCVLMPTGAGKSLCYQIPALLREGVALIVSPLIALMDDQVAAMKELGVRAACLHSGLPQDTRRNIYQSLKSGTIDLLYIAPERLMMPDFQDLLTTLPLSLLAIDEAHCISAWGHDFRPEYRQIAQLRATFPDLPCIALTATADTPTRNDIMQALNLPEIFTSGFDRPNIRYLVTPKDTPRQQLLSFLQTQERGASGIVYCLSRKKVEETAAFLCQKGYHALPYHAGLDPALRSTHQSRFLKEEGIIMVATIAFGMGINKPDVRFVIHLDLPKNIEAYYQETGRAGRDGLPSTAWMVYGMQDVALQGQMIESSDAPDTQKRLERQKLGALLSYCETPTCRRQVLLEYFGDEAQACGNCDTCLTPPKTFDATIHAQKLLSCIHRTGERFGAGHVIDVLLGSTSERITQLGHDTLSTFGIGTDTTQKQWQSIIRQLASLGYIRTNMESYGALNITPKGREFLKERQEILLREDPLTQRSKALNKPDTLLTSDADRALFSHLKSVRLQIAQTNSIPPYVIFHDRTLLEMVNKKPANLNEMAKISGVGTSKLEKYGETFLSALHA